MKRHKINNPVSTCGSVKSKPTMSTLNTTVRIAGMAGLFNRETRRKLKRKKAKP